MILMKDNSSKSRKLWENEGKKSNDCLLYSRAHPFFEKVKSKNYDGEKEKDFEMSSSSNSSGSISISISSPDKNQISNRKFISFGPKVELKEIGFSYSDDSMELEEDIELFMVGCKNKNIQEEDASVNCRDDDMLIEDKDIILSVESSSHSELPSHSAILLQEDDREKKEQQPHKVSLPSNRAVNMVSPRVSKNMKSNETANSFIKNNITHTNNHNTERRSGCCLPFRKRRSSKNDYIASMHSFDKKSTNNFSIKSLKLNDSLSKLRKQRSLTSLNEATQKGRVKDKENCQCEIF